jgi:septal ring factor EnvC (AmiA/AmiB activator)
MTTEGRFARIAHVPAALAEERRQVREEDRQLWRDTQRQIQETNAAIANTQRHLDALTLKTEDAIARTNAAIRAESERAKAAEDELRDRIASLVSAMGEFLARLPTK